MKIFHGIKVALTLSLLALCGLADAQVYNKFGPATGVLKGSTATYQTSAAAAADITGLFSCLADTSHFLNGAGTCTIPAGTGVSSVTVPAPLTATTCTGGACAITWTAAQTANRVLATPDGTTGAVSLRALVAGDIPPINLGSTANGGVSSATILLGTNGGTSNGFFSITGPATSLKTFTFPNASATVLTTNAAVTVPQGGTGVATLTNHGVLLGQGTSNVSAVAAMGLDTLLMGQGASADPAAAAVPNCGSGTTALNYSTSTHAFGCQTITAGGTGTVTNVATGTGLTGGPITSTGTLSVDQSSSLTWTGTETFSNATLGVNISSVTPNLELANTAGAVDTKKYLLSASTTDLVLQTLTDAGASGKSILDVARSGTALSTISIGNATDSPTTNINGLNVSPFYGTFTMTYTGFGSNPGLTASYSRIGNLVMLTIPGSAVATSNATTLATNLPAVITPTQDQNIFLTSNMCEDNGVIGGFTCVADVRSIGAISFLKAGASAGWTASGSKGITNTMTIAYLLN